MNGISRKRNRTQDIGERRRMEQEVLHGMGNWRAEKRRKYKEGKLIFNKK